MNTYDLERTKEALRDIESLCPNLELQLQSNFNMSIDDITHENIRAVMIIPDKNNPTRNQYLGYMTEQQVVNFLLSYGIRITKVLWDKYNISQTIKKEYDRIGKYDHLIEKNFSSDEYMSKRRN